MKRKGFGLEIHLGPSLVFVFVCSLALGKFLHISEAQFPHLSNGEFMSDVIFIYPAPSLMISVDKCCFPIGGGKRFYTKFFYPLSFPRFWKRSLLLLLPLCIVIIYCYCFLRLSCFGVQKF